MFFTFSLLFLSILPSTICAQSAALYVNPVLSSDFPDPSVTRSPSGTFYAYATMGNGHHLQVASSANLVNWTYLGEAMPSPAGWTSGGCFWAPDVQYHADMGLYVMYYAASTKSVQGTCTAMCIGVATSESPSGPFSDAATAPLVCGDAFEAIDPKSFDDNVGSGGIYLYWGSGGAPIMVRELAPNRTAWAPGSMASPVLLPNASRPYESLVEGAWLHAHGGMYYLFTSGDACCGGGANYAIITSSSANYNGPFLRRGDADGTGHDVMLSQAPSNGSLIAAPGHNCIVTDDAGNDWILYHGYPGGNRNGPRALMLDLLQWTTPNGTLSPVGTWPVIANGVPSTTPQIVPFIKPSAGLLPGEEVLLSDYYYCLRASLTFPQGGYTSAGVFERATGKLVRTLWSRRETAAGQVVPVAWDGYGDSGGALMAGCGGVGGVGERGESGSATGDLLYEVKAIAGHVTYVWEGLVGNTGSLQVGPNPLRAEFSVADLDIAGTVGVMTTGYGERNKQWSYFDVAAPNNVTYIGHEDYHAAFTAVATDGELAYFMNAGVPAPAPSYYYTPWTWIAAVNLSTNCEYQFSYGTNVCNEGDGQTSPEQVCNNSKINGTVPQGGNAWDGCNGAEQFYSSVIDIRIDSGVVNASGGGAGEYAYPSTGTGIAVQRSPSTGAILAVAHGYLGVIATFDKRSGAPLGNVSVPGGVFVSSIRFSPDGEALWAITSAGVAKYTGLEAGSLSVALMITGSEVPSPSALGIDPASGSALVTSDATQQVFVLDANSGAILRTYGSPGGYSATTGPTVSPSIFSFATSPYVAADGVGGLWVSDQGNRRTLQLDAGTGDYIDQVQFIAASYVSTVAFGAPSRVFSNFLEFQVNYSIPLGQPGSFTLLYNWAAGLDPSIFLARGEAWAGPTSLAQVGNRTFGVIDVAPPGNSYVQVLAEFVPPTGSGSPGGVRILRLAGYNPHGEGYLPQGQLDSSGDFHFVVQGSGGSEGEAYFAVYSAPLIINASTGAANYSCNAPSASMEGCVQLARVNMSDPAISLAPRGATCTPKVPLTRDGLLIIFDASIQRNGGYHLGALNNESEWVWQSSPWGSWEYEAMWEVLEPGHVNVSVGYLAPDTVDGRFGANDATINYAGSTVLADTGGDNVVYGFHGEFWMDAEANQFVHFHSSTGLFIGQFGVPNKRETNYSYPYYAIAGQAGNSFSPSLVRATAVDGQSALFLYHNDENAHDGVHRWRFDGIDDVQVISAQIV